MTLLRSFARTVVLLRLAWRRGWMILLGPAFRRHGAHLLFDPRDHFNFENIEVGDDVAIGSGAVLMATESRIIIGNKVLLGPNVTIIGGDHNASVVGKFMYDYEVQEKRPEDDQDVIIEDDVWIGTGAIILKGVRLGRGSIVAAGALVRKDVLPYTIVGGVPATVIALRFDNPETISRHEQALYPPDRRLRPEELAKIPVRQTG